MSAPFRFQWGECLDLQLEPGWVYEGTCTGECCRSVVLSASPERIAELAARRVYAQKYTPDAALSSGVYDAPFVVAHFVPTDWGYKINRDALLPLTHPARPNKSPRYRCTAWDGRRCTKYAQRPLLCRIYGVISACDFRDAGCILSLYPLFLDHARWENEGGPCGPEE